MLLKGVSLKLPAQPASNQAGLGVPSAIAYCVYNLGERHYKSVASRTFLSYVFLGSCGGFNAPYRLMFECLVGGTIWERSGVVAHWRRF